MGAKLLRPHDLDGAVAMLSDEQDARLISGGATLVAMINADLVRPGVLVGLDGIADLRGIAGSAAEGLRVGATTRHRETAADPRFVATLRVVAEAAGVIANPVVRNMGTMGGSVAFSDPGADYPPALVAARAEIEVTGPGGARRVPAAAFFVDWYTTALEDGEIVTAIHLPPAVAGASTYRKIARTAGDFAIASCAAVVEDGGAVRVAVGGCGPAPISDPEAEDELAGRLADRGAVRAFAERLAEKADPMSDVRGTAAYRLRLIPRIVEATLGDLAGMRERAA